MGNIIFSIQIKWRWMAIAIGAHWALFLCLNELLPENSSTVLIIFPLKDLDYLRTEWWQRTIQQLVFSQDLVSAGVRNKIG